MTYLSPDLLCGPGLDVNGYKKNISEETLAGAHQTPTGEQRYYTTVCRTGIETMTV